MKKKKIILVIRRSFLEFEYIFPILREFSSSYELDTIFLNLKSYKSLKGNKPMYNEWRKLNNNYYIQKKHHFLFYKIMNFVLSKINMNIFQNLRSKLIEKLHSPSVFLEKIKIDSIQKVNLVFTEYGNFSIWIKQLYFEKKRPKIIFFPSATQIYSEVNDKFSFNGRKLYGDLLLTISKRENTFWKNFIEKNKITSIGVPKFTELYYKKKIKKKNKKKTILFAFGHAGNQWLNEDKLEEICRFLASTKNTKVIVKMHPFKREKFATNLVNKLSNKDFIVSEKLIIDLCKEADLLISNSSSSATPYGNLYKIPVISVPNYLHPNLITDNMKLGLIKYSKNFKDFQNNVNLALYKTNSKVWLDQRKKFKKNYFEKGYRISDIKKIIEK